MPGGRPQKQKEPSSCSLWKGEHKHSKLGKLRKEGNMLLKKEEGKIPQYQINEEEIGNLPEKELREMIER